MKKHYDILVLGAGSGGLNVASFMNRVGFSVLLVDKKEESVGGDCLNYGCVPSKALLSIAHEIYSARQLTEYGVTVSGEVDIEKILDRVRARQNIFREHENVSYFQDLGIDVALGEAQFVSENSISVSGVTYSGKRVVIATGSRPRQLSLPGIENIPVYTNETIFNLDTFPSKLTIIGGGPIGFEMADAFSALGVEVTVINRDDRWLAKEERDTVAVLKNKLEERGVVFIAHAIPKEVKKNELVLEHGDGEQSNIALDALFVAIGRELNHDLSLAAAGIQMDGRGRLVLDKYLRTTNKRVFAVGDVIGQHQFTHAAEMHASVVIENFFKPRFLWKKLDTTTMAWVTYTDPEIASFGYTQSMLSDLKQEYTTEEVSLSEDDRAISTGCIDGFLRVYVDKNGYILGGTMVGKNAGELVGEIIFAMTHRMKLDTVFQRVFPYPTAARIQRRVAGEYLSRKLTPVTKKLLKILY